MVVLEQLEAVLTATRSELRAAVGCVVEYRRPLRFDEAFEVEVALGRIGRTSLTFTPAIWVAGELEPRATGEVVWVHADQATMRAVPLPEELLTLLEHRSGIRQGV
jgi:acyl-CoA thioester hydrolase